MVTASLTGLIRTIFIIVVSLLIVRFISRIINQKAANRKMQELEQEAKKARQQQGKVTVQKQLHDEGEYVDYEIIE